MRPAAELLWGTAAPLCQPAHLAALAQAQAGRPTPSGTQARPRAASGAALAELLGRLHAAAQAAQAVHQAMLQRTGSGTGDVLRHNFRLLVQTVREQDSHLLVAQETHLLEQFQAGAHPGPTASTACSRPCASAEPEHAWLPHSRLQNSGSPVAERLRSPPRQIREAASPRGLLQALPDACQALYMRLHQRVGPWFRTAMLEYSEVADMPATVQQAVQAGFAARLDPADPAGVQSMAEVGARDECSPCVSVTLAAHGVLRCTRLAAWQRASSPQGVLPNRAGAEAGRISRGACVAKPRGSCGCRG